MTDLTPHPAIGGRGHEYWEAYKARNRADSRSFEEEELLRDGIACLDHRLAAVTGQLKSGFDGLDARRSEVTSALDSVSSALAALAKRLDRLRSVTVDVQTRAVNDVDRTVVQQIVDTLVSQDKTWALLQKEIEARGTTPTVTINATADSSSSSQPRADADPKEQINPTVPVRAYYDPPSTDFDFAIASIPDPRVPRHRRQYDNAISAINQGMLNDGFVLDKFGFPWSQDLLPPAVGVQKHDTRNDSTERSKFVMDDDQYGLMIFRRDVWRDQLPPGVGASSAAASSALDKKAAAARYVQIRALYLVTETGTYGVPPAAFASAVTAIDSALEQADPDRREPLKPLVVFGPTFSGSVNSIREAVLPMVRLGAELDQERSHIAELHLVSPSATVETNRQISGIVRIRERPIVYSHLARTDTEKLKAIGTLAKELSVAPSKIAIVYESTTFGIEACKDYLNDATGQLDICKHALKLPFPVNIADVRYGIREKTAARAKKTEVTSVLPEDTAHLSLEEGAENGSEFPESQQSPLTAASTELELEALVTALSVNHAKLVVIIATDVRDRLFLIEKIGKRLDGALFVDFGTDRLLAGC